MPVNSTSLNRKLYDSLRVKGYQPKPLDIEGKITPVPEEAVVIKFDFIKDGEKYGPVWLSIEGSNTLEVYYGDDVSNSPDERTPNLDYDDTWLGLIKYLKNWSQRRQLGFELKNENHLASDMAKRKHSENINESVNEDFSDIAKGVQRLMKNKPSKSTVITKHLNKAAGLDMNRDFKGSDKEFRRAQKIANMQDKDLVAEGYYAMGKQASYSDAIPTTKIILQHTRKIEEGEQRYRNIAKIFVENMNGERFLIPTTKPGIARVYARHIAEGGTPYDERGKHITSLVEEYSKMAGFVRATRNKQFNESAQTLINEGISHYQSLRETLHKMCGHRGYNAYFENYTPTLIEDGEEQSNLNELFVQETLDPRIESVMPILSRLHKNVSEMAETKDLAEWADEVVNEKLELEDQGVAEAAKWRRDDLEGKTWRSKDWDDGELGPDKIQIDPHGKDVDNTGDELTSRPGSWGGKYKRMTKKGTPTQHELGMQNNLKMRMKMKKKEGGLTGPKGDLPEGQGVAEGLPPEKKTRVTVDHYGSNKEVPLYTKTYSIRTGDEDEAIATVKKLFGGTNHRIEKQDVEEGGVLKSIKRGLQGWDKNAVGPGGVKLGDPKDIVRRNKAHDIDTAKKIRAGLDDAPAGTPAGLQKRVLDRKLKGVAEGSLEEVSKKMLGRYVSKARDDLSTAINHSYRDYEDDEADEKDNNRAEKRQSGIDLARAKVNKSGKSGKTTAKVKATEGVAEGSTTKYVLKVDVKDEGPVKVSVSASSSAEAKKKAIKLVKDRFKDARMYDVLINSVRILPQQGVAESDISGLLAASKLNKSFIITAELAEGGTKKYRVKAQSKRVAKEKFMKHHSMAKIVDVKEENLDEGMPSSVAKHKQDLAYMSPAEFAKKFADKSDEELMAMAWRHGYGKGSKFYVAKRNKGKEVAEDLDANQKRAGQLGPTEKVGPKGAVGKLVGN